MSTPPLARWVRTGCLLRKAFAGAGRTQTQAAKEIGVGQSAVWHWLAGRTTPSMRHRQRVCEVLGVDPHVLATAIRKDHEAYGIQQYATEPRLGERLSGPIEEDPHDIVAVRILLRPAAQRLGIDPNQSTADMARSITRAVCRGEM